MVEPGGSGGGSFQSHTMIYKILGGGGGVNFIRLYTTFKSGSTASIVPTDNKCLIVYYGKALVLRIIVVNLVPPCFHPPSILFQAKRGRRISPYTTTD